MKFLIFQIKNLSHSFSFNEKLILIFQRNGPQANDIMPLLLLLLTYVLTLLASAAGGAKITISDKKDSEDHPRFQRKDIWLHGKERSRCVGLNIVCTE